MVAGTRPVADVRTFANRVKAYFSAFETRVTGYSRLGGETTRRVSGHEFDRSGESDTVEGLAFWLGYEDINDGRLVATVTADLLRRYRVELNPTSAITVVEEVRVTDLGSTRVPPPGSALGTAGNQNASGRSGG